MRYLIVAALLGGCASSVYTPHVVAPGELTLRYDQGFELWNGPRKVSEAPTWRRLDAFVRCVPEAEETARRAHANGAGSVALSVLGGTLGVSALAGLVGGVVDSGNRWTWFGGGIGVAVVGTVLSSLSYLLRNRANGQAVDAHNQYNDAVGAWGARCARPDEPQPVLSVEPSE